MLDMKLNSLNSGAVFDVFIQLQNVFIQLLS